MDIYLNGERIADKESLHDALQESFAFPSYYGRNLDALFDLLTDVSSETVLHLLNTDALVDRLGYYGEKFLRVLDAAARENGNFSWLRE